MGHEPQRTCVGCRAVRPKRLLVRLRLDETGSLRVGETAEGGRGAYLCPSGECVRRALGRQALARALRRRPVTADAASLLAAVAAAGRQRD